MPWNDRSVIGERRRLVLLLLRKEKSLRDCCRVFDVSRKTAYKWFMEHGLAETFASYGAQPADLQNALEHQAHHGLDQLVELIPLTHRQFIRELENNITDIDNMVTSRIESKDDIYKSIKDFLGKGK